MSSHNRSQQSTENNPKYVVVTGGVMSGLGKGVTAASLGRLLIDRGLSVTAIKIDPYINVDAGTMSPGEHGEVYVLDDGTEVDLDLGNYERFLNIEMGSENNITTGKVFQEVISKERNGDYLGETVQIIPHITDEIQSRINAVATNYDVCLIEIGGTVGDIEGMPFLESIRQLRDSVSDSQFLLAHVTLIPYSPNNEQKTKPTQHSIKELRGIGLEPDVIVGRCSDPLTPKTKEKISLFGNIPSEAVISNPDVDNIYRAPFQLHTEGFDSYTISQLELKDSCDNSLLSPSENSQNGSVHVYDSPWYKTVSSPRNSLVNVTLLGKYQIEDSYMSVVEALNHAGMNTETEIDLDRCVTNNTEDIPSTLTDTDALIIPGGFDVRGVETKINALKYARENDIPTLGLCLGFQLMIVEYARNICGLNNAHSTEFAEDTPHPVIDIMPDQYDIEELGGSMRLGSYTADVKEGTKAYELYGGSVNGRHRHRYEMNPTYISTITDDYPLTFSAEMNNRMEIVELPTHPFYFGTQFHPEYTSRPTNPSTAFTELIKRAINYRTSRK